MNNAHSTSKLKQRPKFAPLWLIAMLFLAGLFILPSTNEVQAQAGQFWFLEGVTFNNGATAEGAFRFDAATGTYSDVIILVTDPGGSGTRFTAPIPVDPGTPTKLTGITDPTGNLVTRPALNFTFVSALTAAGGTVDIQTGTTSVTGICGATDCSVIVSPFRDVTGGRVTTNPIPTATPTETPVPPTPTPTETQVLATATPTETPPPPTPTPTNTPVPPTPTPTNTPVPPTPTPTDTSTPNTAPLVNAGPDQTITLPADANLNGSASDDGLPNPPGTMTVQWTQVSGSGIVTFSHVTSTSTTASFSDVGTYILRLTADDGALTTSDEMTMTVNRAAKPNDVTIFLPILIKTN